MKNGTTPDRQSPRASVRERLRHANELQALPTEMMERLLNLADRLNAAAEMTSRTIDENASRLMANSHDVLENLNRNARRVIRATRRLSEQQHALAETDRNLAYTIERFRRQVDRIAWLQTGVILLAMIAGMLGGAAAALVILNSMR